MKTTFLSARDEKKEIKIASLNGFWKEESLKSYCERRKWIPVDWKHCHITAGGVCERKQGNFRTTTNISSFRDHAGEMGF